MSDAWLLGAAGLGLLCATIWAYVASLLLRRPVSDEHRTAARAFGIAWLAASAYALLNAILSLAFAWGELPASLAFAIAWGTVIAGMTMLATLVMYLAHLLTGRRRAIPIVAALSFSQMAATIVVIALLHPVGVETTGWTTRFVFARSATAANAMLAISGLVPAALASLGYLAAYPKATTVTARWRIALVGGSLTLWVATAILVRTPLVADGFLGSARLAAALAALAVWAAYAPPRWAQERFGVESLAEEIAHRPRPRVQDPMAALALQQRLRDLL